VTVGHRKEAKEAKQAASPCLVFVHIPKTAGKTIEGALQWHFRRDPDGVIRLNDTQPFEDLQAFPVETRARARAILGHVPYGVHRFLSQPSTYFTFVRQPVDRVLSSYRWIIHQPHEPLYARFGRDTAGLDEYVSADIDKETVENGQTRMIAGITGKEEPDRDTLETAKRNLETFIAVGLTERFDESFLLLRNALAWRNAFYATRNVSPEWTRRIKPSDRTLEVIRERNQLDLELYEFAAALLDRAVAQGGRAFQRDLALFKALSRVPNAIGRRAGGLVRAYVRSPLVGGLRSAEHK